MIEVREFLKDLWFSKVGRRLRMTVFNVYVVLNMLLCAIVFIGRSYPRETISGYVGRQVFRQKRWALWVAEKVIDPLHEPGHCGLTAMQEDIMRAELYPVESGSLDPQKAEDA